MIKFGGYIFTLIHLAGAFFPSALSATASFLTQISGHLAFALFALLIARGARRTSNHFLYFVRLLVSALVTEVILYTASKELGLYFAGRNALFTYAASIALIAGLSMAIGCYQDLVAHAVPAGGEIDRKILFGVPANPGNYRMAPAMGIVLGLATAGLALFVTLFFNFSYGLFGLFYILLAFMAMREAASPQRPVIRNSIFSTRGECGRALLYLTALAAVAILLSFVFISLRAKIPLSYLATLTAIPLAAILPEGRPLSPGVRRLPYAALPALTGIFFLLRLIIR